MSNNLNIIFLSYYERSGSSFLLNKLSKFKDVLVCPEGEVLVNILLRSPDVGRKINLQKLFCEEKKLVNWNLDKNELLLIQKKYIESDNYSGIETFIAILDAYRKLNNHFAKVIVFKAFEINYVIPGFMDELLKKYNLKFISLIRDGRACYSSFLNAFPEASGVLRHAMYHALKWNYYVKNVLEEKNRTLIIKYEDLIVKNDEVFSGVLNYIGIKDLDTEEKDNYFLKLNKDEKKIHARITHPPDVSRVNAWERILSDKEICIFNLYAGKYLQKMGYKQEIKDCFGLKKYLLKIFSLYYYGKLFQHRYSWEKEIILNFSRSKS